MSSPLVVYARMIKLSHTVFALPFALAAALLASLRAEVTLAQLGWVLACMVLARSTAMGFNRIIDRDIDAANPRTASREIPSGQISLRAAWAFTLLTAVGFLGAAAMLGRATLLLAPVALAVVWGYSLTKRFTVLCHVVLGFGLALAPTGVWVALTGTYGSEALLLSVAVLTWVAGFDIVYSCQDASFDREAGLHSLPAVVGVRGALRISVVLHAVTILALVALPACAALGWVYGVGVAAITGVLIYEHSIVTQHDLSRINKAFFDLNGWVSILFLVFVVMGVWSRPA